MRSSFANALAKHAKPDAAELGRRNRESGLTVALRLYPQDPDPAALTGPTAWVVFEGGVPRLKAYDGEQKVYVAGGGISADRGDRDVTLVPEDADEQRFDTALTANRSVALPAQAEKGRPFRIVRGAATPGAFALTVGSPAVKTIPSNTRAFVDVTFDGLAWKLSAYGTL